MLKIRVIPTLLYKNFGLVKGVRFNSTRRMGTLLPAIRVYNTREVDEIVLLDIMATEEQRQPDLEMVREAAAECFVPLTVGGGLNSVDAVTQILHAGADKVSLNSATFADIDLIRRCADRFGSQCVVISIDAARTPDGEHKCFTHCGTRPAQYKAEEWAALVEEAGAGEILLTSIDKDGTLSGYDVGLVQRVSSTVRIPVIASGGAGNADDVYTVLVEGGASAAAAASAFHFTELTPAEIKRYLAANDLPVRVGPMNLRALPPRRIA